MVGEVAVDFVGFSKAEGMASDYQEITCDILSGTRWGPTLPCVMIFD